MDRFTQLAAFVQTVDRGSQSAAARALGVTPAMVGRYIAGLEDRLGTRLLNRTTARQSPTRAGQAFHAQAQAILGQLEAAEHQVAAMRAEPHGTIRINAPMVFGVRFLSAALAAFSARHSGLRTELVLDDEVVDLVGEGYDLAVRIGRLPDSSLVSRRLAPCRTLLCAAPAYLRRHPPPAEPADLRHHNCLLYAYASTAGSWHLTHRTGGHQVHQPIGGNLVANNGDALLAAAIEGAGIVLQPLFIAADALRAGQLVPVLPDWRLPELAIHAIYQSSRHLPSKVRAVVDHLARALSDPPWERAIPRG